VPVPYEAEAGKISIALVGDAMINRRTAVHREPEYLALLDVVRSADFAVANLETQINEFEHTWAQKPGSISWQVGEPACLDDLRWMGFDAVTVASNHSFDFGEAGFLTTLRHVRERGLASAGGGTNLAEARAPAVVDLARGRVALMAACSTFSDQSAAGASRPDFPGRPGINALHHDVVHHVPREIFDALTEAKRGLGYEEYEDVHHRFHPHRAEHYDRQVELRFMGRTFRSSDRYDIETSCGPSDLAGIERSIRGSAKHTDWRVYSLHSHESGTTGEIHEVCRESPPAFFTELAHRAIDSGCHVVTGHGPHFLRGIEIYAGRPIFYSLGNFVFHNDTVRRQPEPAYARQGLGDADTPGDWGAARSGDGAYGFPVDPAFYRSVVAVCSFAGGELDEVRLHPVDLGYGKPMSQRGRPLPASREVADEIIEWLRRLSEPYGTKIENADGVGVIRSVR
jgi:poly-gamma-glutamate synthesis protein (capsule biosynthesis protein)